VSFAAASAFRAVLCVGAALFSTGAPGQKIPALEGVNPALSDPPRTALETRRAALVSTRASLRDMIAKYEGHCLLRESGSRADRECPGEKASLEAGKEAYVVAVKSFNWDLEQAVGEYRNVLEKRLRDLNEGLARDAAAIRNQGFKRRAEDFEDLARLSSEAHRLAFLKVMDVLVDEAAPLITQGIVGKLRELRATGLGPGEAKAILKQFDDANLVNPKARAYLREVARGSTPGVEGKLAGAIQEDLQQMREIDTAGGKGQKLEAALKLVQWVAPPGSGIMEIAVWVGYDITAQTLVSGTVTMLNDKTIDQLKGLNAIICVSQRRLVEKHAVGFKLAALEGRPFDRQRPMVNDRCIRVPGPER